MATLFDLLSIDLSSFHNYQTFCQKNQLRLARPLTGPRAASAPMSAGRTKDVLSRPLGYYECRLKNSYSCEIRNDRSRGLPRNRCSCGEDRRPIAVTPPFVHPAQWRRHTEANGTRTKGSSWHVCTVCNRIRL